LSDWKSQLVDELASIRNSFLSNAQSFMVEQNSLRERLSSVDSTPTESAWETFKGILAALVSSVVDGDVSGSALASARTSFEKMSDSASKRIPTKTQMGSAVSEAVLASYGVFLVSTLEQDTYRAALIIYRTTESYPEAAVQVFPTKAYPSEYREILQRSYRDRVRAVKVHTELESTNRSKKVKRYPTFILRSLVVLPLTYAFALLAALGPLPANLKARRGAGYQHKVSTIYEARVAAFDKAAMAGGWKIGRNEIQKEAMLLDQVKRLTTIFNNHSRTAVQESKARRRQLEANSEMTLSSS
jgi:hypothetical protein